METITEPLNVSDAGEMMGVAAVGGPEPSKPYTSTSVEVPTYTLPFAIVGTANFTAFPAASRVAFCPLL